MEQVEAVVESVKAVSSRVTYRADIDGLRAIAIIAVILFHAGVPFARGGFVGVDVFFVISGYLIGAMVFREVREGRFSLQTFYLRRAKRILPAFFLVLGISYGLAVLLLSPSELKSFAWQTLGALGSTSNIYFGLNSDYFASAAELNPLLMTWSLGVEEQFYLFFPLIMLVLSSLRQKSTLVVFSGFSLGSFAVATFLLHTYPVVAFYFLPSRAWELGLGTILGIYESIEPNRDVSPRRAVADQILSVAGLGMLLYAVAGYTASTPFPGAHALLPTAATVLLIRTRSSWLNRSLLAGKPFVAIGLVSYSWYLWHWPFMSFARVVLAGELPLWLGSSLALLSLLLAIVTYFAVERPFRRATPRPGRTLLNYGGMLLAMALPAVALLLDDGWPGRYSKAFQVDRAALENVEDPCLQGYRRAFLMPGAVCNAQDGTEPGLAVMGDSHAAALAPYLRSIAQETGWKVADFTKASCSQLNTVARSMPSRPNHASECEAFNQNALTRVLQRKDVHTVLLAGYWSAPFPTSDDGQRYIQLGEHPDAVSLSGSWTNLSVGLEGTIRRLQAGGKRVVLAVDVPILPLDPVLVSRTRAIPFRAYLADHLGGTGKGVNPPLFTPVDEQADWRARALVLAVAKKTGASVLDLPGALCQGSTCRYEARNKLFYLDTQHLSFSGAAFALRNAPLFW